jgi:hypothetical protein
MKIKRIVAAGGVLLAAFAAPAAAQASTGKTCQTGYVTAYVLGGTHTSCPFARATARKASRFGYPTRLRVYSPVTHKWYRLYRTEFDSYYSWGWATYEGHGSGGNIGVGLYERW